MSSQPSSQFIIYQTEDGQTLIAVIEDIDENNLVLDLNHPLSGKNLEFEIHLLAIEQRAA